MRQQLAQDAFIDDARRRQLAFGIVGLAGVPVHPIVDQGVAWPGVEGGQRAIGGDVGEIGDPADIEKGRGALRQLGGQRAVIGRHERRALPTGGHVGRAHIIGDVDARQSRQQRAIAQLHGQSGIGPVQHGLPVKTDDIDGRGLQHAVAHEAQNGVGVPLRQVLLKE